MTFQVPVNSAEPIYKYDPLCSNDTFNGFLLSRMKCPGGKLNFTEGCRSHVENSTSPTYVTAVMMLILALLLMVIVPCIIGIDLRRGFDTTESMCIAMFFTTFTLIVAALSWRTSYAGPAMDSCPPLPSSLYGGTDDRDLQHLRLTVKQYREGCYFYPSPLELAVIYRNLASCRNARIVAAEAFLRLEVGVVTSPELQAAVESLMYATAVFLTSALVIWVTFLVIFFCRARFSKCCSSLERIRSRVSGESGETDKIKPLETYGSIPSGV